jgi:hypothetical protein
MVGCGMARDLTKVSCPFKYHMQPGTVQCEQYFVFALVMLRLPQCVLN